MKNYFTVAWRNLIRNKSFSVTNLLGLAIGLTCTILIFLWISDEISFNKFHANYSNIYQVMVTSDFKNDVLTDDAIVFPLSKAIEKGNTQIKNAVVTSYQESHIIEYGNTRLKKNGFEVSDHYFDIFSWKFLSGNPAMAIADPTSIVLTESAAKAFFGNEDPVNKVIKLDNNQNFKVSAVVADPPGNSTFQFDFIVPYNYSSDDTRKAMTDWVNSSNTVYIQTVPGANMTSLDKYINTVKRQHTPDDKVNTYFTFPMAKWHLYSDFKHGKNVGGMITYVRLFAIITLIILLIACVNFMNLSTARSEKRAKEVGIRKTLGSDRKRLILQFFIESMILVCVAFFISIVCVLLLLPSFNNLVGKHLNLNIGDPLFWIGAITIIIFTGVIAGSYPALYLSSFNPVKVLKGSFTAGKNAMLPRRILVVMQFVASIVLISATIIVYEQIQHVKGRDMGYNPNNLIMLPASQAVNKNYPVIKQELLNSGMINSVTRTLSSITGVDWKTPSPDYAGKPANAKVIFSGLTADVDFTKTMGVKLLQGRDFVGTPGDSAAMLLNKAAIDVMNIKNPVGMIMRARQKNYRVVGVIGNVVMESPYKPVDPMLIYYRPAASNMVTVRLNKDVQPQKAIQMLSTLFEKYNPGNPFEYQFVDQEFGKKFLTEQLISSIATVFAGLAIFICCIGLTGLVSFTIEKRFREIGVRKVLGATVRQLLMLISGEFVKLVLVAFAVSIPLTWWLMYKWLQNYDYRITISIWLFWAVGIVVVLLTLAVVSLNTISAALSNPVKSLRSE